LIGSQWNHVIQLEKSPTLGSVETSDEEKRYLAEQSAQFNLKDKIFVELFPDIVEVRKIVHAKGMTSSLMVFLDFNERHAQSRK